MKPETGFPGLKICTIYPCANATEKRGLKVFNQFSGCCVLSFAASGDKSAEVSWAVPATSRLLFHPISKGSNRV